MKIQKFTVIKADSGVEWIAKRVTGAHNRSIALKAGEVTLTGGKISGGQFISDTTGVEVSNVPDLILHAQLPGHPGFG